MSLVECKTCRWHDEVDQAQALKLATKHRCPGTPFPLRGLRPPAVIPTQTTELVQPSTKQRAPRRPWQDLEEDISWLVRGGTPLGEMCRRLEVTVDQVQQAYRRHGQPIPAPFRVAPRRQRGAA